MKRNASATLRRRIAALQKRLAHLEQRIYGTDDDLSYDKAEASALRFALRILEETDPSYLLESIVIEKGWDAE